VQMFLLEGAPFVEGGGVGEGETLEENPLVEGDGRLGIVGEQAAELQEVGFDSLGVELNGLARDGEGVGDEFVEVGKCDAEVGEGGGIRGVRPE